MIRLVDIKIVNTNKTVSYPMGTKLKEIVDSENLNLEYPIIGAEVNNAVKELNYEIFKPKTVKFFDVTDPDGMRMYVRSLTFVLYKAVKDLYPDGVLKVRHSVSKGLFCEVKIPEQELTEQIVSDIRNRMRVIVDMGLEFKREEMETEKAVEIFRAQGLDDKCRLFCSRDRLYTSVYTLDGCINYYSGHLVPDTTCLKTFDLVKYFDGVLLRTPKISNPNELEDIVKQDKMFEIFKEHKHFAEIIGASDVGSLNEMVEHGELSEIIKVSEALHEKRIAHIADNIHTRNGSAKLVLIAGPSSSGKTTFAKRLSVQLRLLGYHPVAISLDDYFHDRENTPRDESGEYDFEILEAIDTEFFNNNLKELMSGKEISRPKFSFSDGKRLFNGEKYNLKGNDIFLVEGIHALNPKLTNQIPTENKYMIYVSALTQIAVDDHNRIQTTDNRLLRRIVRDNKYRGIDALYTIKRWPSVRRGEDNFIFPYQENADMMFNSALFYEFVVLKNLALPLLTKIPETVPEHAEAKRLIKFLSFFKDADMMEIPPTSIIREFLGGSSFIY